MTGNSVAPDANPGTDRRIEYLATAPCDCGAQATAWDLEHTEHDDDCLLDEQVCYRLNGTLWRCGRQYWDTVLQDIVVLTSVYKESGPYETGEPSGPVKLRFEPKRLSGGPIEVSADRQRFDDLSSLDDRFQLRNRDTSDRGPTAPDPPC